MSTKFRYRNGLIALFTATFIMAAWQPPAQAVSSILGDFNSTYGTSGTRLDTCDTCHTSGFGFNPYGNDFRNAGENFSAIENLDSDGDGFTNIVEINALTFPGDANDAPAVTPPPPPANQSPVANANGPYSGTLNTPVQFDGSASNDPDGTIVSYDWNFGDGASGTGVSPSHAYSSDGTFNVTLMVTDDAGATDTASSTAVIGVGNQPPIANANGPYNGTVDVAMQFSSAGSSDPDGSIISYSWNFGDGSTGTGASPAHTYTAVGTYNVTLTVTDDTGSTDSDMTNANIADMVTPPPPPLTDGVALYGDNCASCHGSLVNSDVAGASAAAIQSAIDSNRGGMGFLSSMPMEQVQAIAAALAQNPPIPGDGDGDGDGDSDKDRDHDEDNDRDRDEDRDEENDRDRDEDRDEENDRDRDEDRDEENDRDRDEDRDEENDRDRDEDRDEENDRDRDEDRDEDDDDDDDD